jgi:hypothetical protein
MTAVLSKHHQEALHSRDVHFAMHVVLHMQHQLVKQHALHLWSSILLLTNEKLQSVCLLSPCDCSEMQKTN